MKISFLILSFSLMTLVCYYNLNASELGVTESSSSLGGNSQTAFSQSTAMRVYPPVTVRIRQGDTIVLRGTTIQQEDANISDYLLFPGLSVIPPIFSFLFNSQRSENFQRPSADYSFEGNLHCIGSEPSDQELDEGQDCPGNACKRRWDRH